MWYWLLHSWAAVMLECRNHFLACVSMYMSYCLSLAKQRKKTEQEPKIQHTNSKDSVTQTHKWFLDFATHPVFVTFPVDSKLIHKLHNNDGTIFAYGLFNSLSACLLFLQNQSPLYFSAIARDKTRCTRNHFCGLQHSCIWTTQSA